MAVQNLSVPMLLKYHSYKRNNNVVKELLLPNEGLDVLLLDDSPIENAGGFCVQ